jgi:hypothetical protein
MVSGDHVEARIVNVQVVDQHPPGLLVADDRELGEPLEQHRRRAGVVLLHVMDHEIVGRGELVQLARQRGPVDGVDGVDEHVLLAALDEVGVVRGAVGQRDESVEQAAVPVDGADEVHVLADGAWLHGLLGKVVEAACVL